MKYITLILLISLQCFSQKDNGTVTLLDGKVLTGLVKVMDNSFKFKENPNSEVIKYDYKTAKSATYINNKNEEIKYEFVYVDYQKRPL